MKFYQTDPSLDNYWRSIVLFGRNVASYKFALSKSLLDLSNSQSDFISLDDLSPLFARHVCEHLKGADKQGTSKGSAFLDECRKFNDGHINETSLVASTSKLGFKNVIDAFHVVNQEDIPIRFFIDERRSSGGIRLTEEFFKLQESSRSSSLREETEARWRLVETAWALDMSNHLVSYDKTTDGFFTETANSRRVNITSSRDALNGYQKGRCFYSFEKISIAPGDPDLADVDHFFPHTLKFSGRIPNIDGVWNLVLASKACNRGEGGKFAKVPSLNLLKRLHTRNEYLISSHNPLRATLIAQTGKTEQQRGAFLQDCYNYALETLIHTWEPEARDTQSF